MKLKYSVAFALLLLASCVNLDDLRNERFKQPTFDFSVPEDFDWAVLEYVRVDLGVDENYNGDLDYEIEIYDGDKLLDKGYVSSQRRFVTSVAVNKSTKSIKLVQRTLYGKLVSTASVPITGESLSYTFSMVNARSAEARSAQLRSEIEVPSTSDPLPERANPWSGAAMQAGTYVIPAGTICDNLGSIASGAKIYVQGTLVLSESAFRSIKGVELYVTSTGKVCSGPLYRTDNDNQISGNVGAAKFSNCTIINEGIMDFPTNDLHLLLNTSFKNHSNFSVSGCLFVASESELSNWHFADCGYVATTNGTIKTWGKVTVTGTSNSNFNAGSTIYVGAYGELSLLEGNDINLSCPMILEKNAKVLIDKAKFTMKYGSSITQIESTVPDIDEKKDSYAVILGAGDFNCPKFLRNKVVGSVVLDMSTTRGGHAWDASGEKDGWNSDVKMGYQPYEVAYIKASIYNDNGYNSLWLKTEEVDYFDPIYTVAIEDHYPDMGDEDMNDLVMDWRYGTKKDLSNMVEKIAIRINVKAVGAKKTLAAAIRIQGLTPEKIAYVGDKASQENVKAGKYFVTDTKGLEIGTKQVVIPLFENAHELFGAVGAAENGSNRFVNTTEFTEPAYGIDVEITLAEPISSEDLSPENVNLFLVLDGDQVKRLEVHPYGGVVTDKASNRDAVFTDPRKVWGMQYSDAFRYPLEMVSINDAYRSFQSWATSGGANNKDWYKYPEESLVIEYVITR